MRYFRLTFIGLFCINCLFLGKALAYSSHSHIDAFEDQFEFVSEEKFYLKEGGIFVSANEIFVCCGDLLFPVSLVEADELGIFVRAEGFKYGRCPVCNWPLTPWGTCGNPNCPTKG